MLKLLLILAALFSTQNKQPSHFPPISIDSIFRSDHSWTATASARTTLVVTGDVMLGRNINLLSQKDGDYTKPFKKVLPLLRDSHLTYINLETTLGENCPATSSGMLFCGHKNFSQSLVGSGVDIVNLANNHTYNFGESGFDFTSTLLSSANLHLTGTNNETIINQSGVRFSFLGFNAVGNPNTGPSWADPSTIKSKIQSAKQNSDIVVVQFHCGNEYTHKPTDTQIDLAHLAIDSGADIVVGNHPHWIQPVEIYKNKPIVYSHGNFVFDQNWSEETKRGVVSKFSFSGKQLIDLELIPISLNNLGYPDISDPTTSTTTLQIMRGVH